MLQYMRNASQSWLVRGFFAVLVVSFVVLWGVGDVFHPHQGRGQQTIATVGSIKISQHELDYAFKRDVAFLQLRTKQEIDLKKAIQIGLLDRTLQRMVTEALLDQEADHMGLVITDDHIKRTIQSDPAFYDESGSFDKERFLNLLAIMHITEKDYVTKHRGELRRQQLLKALSAGVQAPLALVQPLYLWQYEKRLVDIALIKPADIKVTSKPTQQELKAFYDAHQSQFEALESRDLSTLIVSRELLEKNLILSDAEMAAGFEARQDQLKGGVPTREENERIIKEIKQERTDNLLIELTSKIEDALAEGANLQEIKQKFSLKEIKLSNVEKKSNLEAIAQKESLNPVLLEAILKEGFANEPGTDLTLAEAGPGNYIIVRVEKVHPPHLKPLETIQKEVSAAWQTDKQITEAQTLALKLQKEVNAGTSLVQAAAKHKIKVAANHTLDRSDAAKAEKIPEGIQKRVFDSQIKLAVVGRGSEGYYVVQAKEIIPVKLDVKSKEFQNFTQTVKSMLTNDILDSYLFALEKKYRIEINKRALQAANNEG